MGPNKKHPTFTWEVMVHECGASLFNFTPDYRSSIFWRWLGDLALLWGRFRELWMTGDAFDRGIEVLGVIGGMDRKNELEMD